MLIVCSVFGVIARAIKKELAPRLKKLMSVWLMGMHDQDTTVGDTAKSIFNVWQM